MTREPKPFYFKKFSLEHRRSPMKITTDSILFGSWIPISKKIKTVLEIGTGCGIIAMMLSQRFSHQVDIDAVDINQEAVEECKINCQKAQFTKINPICLNIVDLPDRKYDLIATNPPYFESALKCKTENRTNARQDATLTFEQLTQIVENYLTEEGSFCLVLPFKRMMEFDQLIKMKNFNCTQKVSIRHQKNKSISVVLAEYKRSQNFDEITKESEFILKSESGRYTKEAINLLNTFYLNMEY